jgi:exodeoxyribonuclease V alpha subunit
METISGRIHSVIYYNPDNGYTVAEIDTNGGIISATGILFSVAKGESIVADGDWYQHPKYGNQFKIARLKIDAQPGGGDITSFLSSGLIKGLGEKKAALLAERFGDAVFDVIENDFGLLTQVSGIGAKTARDIHDSYMAVSKERDTVVALTGYGLTVNMALKLFEVYGQNAVRVVESNPYRLIEDVSGVGFARADEIAMRIGIAHDSSERIRAGIMFMLNTYINTGHVYAAEDDLVAHTSRSLGVGDDRTEAVLQKLLTSGRLVLDDTYEQRRIYAAYMYEAETRCAEKIAGLLCARPASGCADFEALLNRFEKDHKLKLDDMQRRAVRLAVEENVSVITGGPGTGKTTIIKGRSSIFLR